MMTRSFRWLTLLAVVAIGTGCGGSDAADEMEPPDAEAPLEDPDVMEEDDGVGEFSITMSGDMTGEVSGTDVACMEYNELRSVSLVGEHNGESLDVALSNESFEDGTYGKVIFGGYLRTAGQGGTLTIDGDGATFEDLEVGAVTITGSASC